MKTKFYKTVLLTFVFSGIFLMGMAAPPKSKYTNMRSDSYRECRSLTGVCSNKEVKKVKKSNEYHKLRKLINTRHW